MSNDKYARQDSKGGILKSTGIISLGTLASRILGFVRDILIAKLLGTAAAADVFFVAFRIPNLFRDLVGEGATNSALVPVISEYETKKERGELWRFVSVFLILSLMVLGAITILGIIFSPVIVRLIAPGFVAEPQKLQTAIQLTQIMFPYLILIGLTAYSMGILYTFRSFSAAAFSPCLLNIMMIISALVAAGTKQDVVFCLAMGVLAGGVAQLLWQIPPLFKNGIKFYKPQSLSHPGVKKVGQLLLPRVFGSAVYQLGIFIDTFCASLSAIVGSGGIAAIYYANRIVQFPMGIFSVALASAILPSMAGFAAKENTEDFKKTLAFALKNIFLIMLPMSVFIAVLSTPMTRLFFERGEFNAYSTQMTAWALLFYALGLVGFGGAKIMVTAFHSLQDTRTPVKVGFVCLAINAFLNFSLMGPMKIGGIALASSISSTVNFLVLFYILNKRLGCISHEMGGYFLKISWVALVMGAGVFWAWGNLSVPNEASRLIASSLFGFFIFIGGCWISKVEEIKKALFWISKKK